MRKKLRQNLVAAFLLLVGRNHLLQQRELMSAWRWSCFQGNEWCWWEKVAGSFTPSSDGQLRAIFPAGQEQAAHPALTAATLGRGEEKSPWPCALPISDTSTSLTPLPELPLPLSPQLHTLKDYPVMIFFNLLVIFTAIILSLSSRTACAELSSRLTIQGLVLSLSCPLAPMNTAGCVSLFLSPCRQGIMRGLENPH